MSTRQEPYTPSKGNTPPGAIADDVLLRERAHAPVEAAIRSHFAVMGGGVDEANIHNATSIVLRGLTPTALSRIASAGISGSELIQTLIPKPAQPGTLPPFNWSSITPADIERLRAAGLLSDHQRKMALGLQSSSDDRTGTDGASRSNSYKSDLPWSEEKLTAYAHQKGVPWLANHPDLKRLTPAAIETFARMQFDRDSYHALTRDAGLSPEKAHVLVKAMEDAKVTPDDAKELAKKMGATSKGLSPEQQEQHRQLMENWIKSLKENPSKSPEELHKLHNWLDKRKEADPGKAKAVEEEKKVLNKMHEERKLEIKTDRKTSITESKAEATVKKEEAKAATVANLADEWNSPAASAPPSPPKPGDGSVPNSQPIVVTKQADASSKPVDKTGAANVQISLASPTAAPKPMS